MNEAPHVGTVLAGRYELVRHLARGGMGDVYEADDHVLHRRVAVKLFRATAPTDRSRFDAEVRVLASLNHPGIVPVFDAGSVGDDAFVVLELIDGPPLRARLDGRPLPAGQVAAIAAQLAEALAYIHGRGVVHRDVTPSNVLCTGDGRVRLVDFGIARLLDAPHLTSPELAVGTAAYMAPEQVQGRDVTGAADIYALGLVLLEALTGQKAFPGPALETSVVRLARDPDTTTGVPGAWQPLLADMTARDPMARPTAAEVEARVAAVAAAGDRSTAAAPVIAMAGRRRPPTASGPARRPRAARWVVGTAAAVALAVVLVLAAGGGAGHGPGDPVDAATTSTATGSEGTAGGTAARAADGRSASPTTASSLPAGTTAAADDPTPTIVDPADVLRRFSPPTTRPASSTTAAPTTTTAAPTTTSAAPTTTSPPTTAPPTTAAPAAG